MKNKKQINLAIIGLGKIAHKFAADIPLVTGVTLMAVASRDLKKAKAFAQAHQAHSYYNNYEAIAGHPAVDLVYIATPNSLHFEHTMMCLDAGKAVLCEKPFALNTSQVSQMIAKAKEKQVFLMEALWTRFIPATQKVIDIIADGTIGEVTGIKADFGFKAAVDFDSRLYDPALGGGSLLDIGIYPVYLSYLLLGEPTTINANATLSTTGVDTQCEMVFDYPNATSKLSCSFIQNTPTEALILGTKGFIKMHSRFHHCKAITVVAQNQQPVFVPLDYLGNGYGYQLAHVADCIKQGKTESPLVSHAHSLHLIGLLDSLRRLVGVKFDQDSY